MGQIKKQQIHLGQLGKILLELGAAPGGGRPRYIVGSIRVLRHILRQTQIRHILPGLIRLGILKHPVKHGIIIGLIVHPAGQGDVDCPQYYDACSGPSAQPQAVFFLHSEQEYRSHPYGTQRGHRDIDKLAPAVHHAGEKIPADIPARTPTFHKNPQGEHHHSQQPQHLYRLAVQRIKIGHIALVTQDKNDGALDQQIAPQIG